MLCLKFRYPILFLAMAINCHTAGAQGFIWNNDKTCQFYTSQNQDKRKFFCIRDFCVNGYLQGATNISVYEEDRFYMTIKGTFVKGYIEGFAEQTFSDHAKFEGIFSKSRRQSGTYTFHEGHFYTGPFDANGQMSGFGTMTYYEGDVFAGQFVNGHASGAGTYTFRKGPKFVGTFVKGSCDSGWLYFEDGSNQPIKGKLKGDINLADHVFAAASGSYTYHTERETIQKQATKPTDRLPIEAQSGNKYFDKTYSPAFIEEFRKANKVYKNVPLNFGTDMSSEFNVYIYRPSERTKIYKTFTGVKGLYTTFKRPSGEYFLVDGDWGLQFETNGRRTCVFPIGLGCEYELKGSNGGIDSYWYTITLHEDDFQMLVPPQ